jgi:hypothetical protein
MLGRQGRVGCYCRLPPPAPAAGPCCGWRRPPAWCDVLAAGLGKQLQRHPCCPLSCPPARLLPQAGGWAGHAGGPPARVAVHQLGARPGHEPSPGRCGGALCGRQQRCVCVRVCACACAMSVPCALHVPQCVAGWHAAGQSADRCFVGWIAAAAGPSRKQPPHHICSCYRSRHPTHPPAPPSCKTPLPRIAEPESSVVELCTQDKFLILATDGVWEFIDPQVGAVGGWVGTVGSTLEAAACCGVPVLAWLPRWFPPAHRCCCMPAAMH